MFIPASFLTGQKLLEELAVSPTSQISLLTCGPGQEVYSVYGHSAIRVFDPADRIDIVFNYGTFDFDTPNFTLKFMRGKLLYQLSIGRYGSFLNTYKRDGQEVTENKLVLDSLQKKQVIDFLADNYKEENRYYKYDFFFDNCSSRIRDLMESVMGTDIRYPDSKGDYTYRDLIKQYQKVEPWTDFGIDMIIGARADKKADISGQMFLPDYLQYYLSNATSDNGIALFEKDYKVLQFDPPSSGKWKLLPIHLFLLLLLFEAVLLYNYIKNGREKILKIWDKIWMISLGLLSVFMLVMWFGTDHMATKNNWNLLWANPAWFLAIFAKKESVLKKNILFFIGFCTFFSCLEIVNFTPQYFHTAVYLIAVISLVKLHRIIYL